MGEKKESGERELPTALAQGDLVFLAAALLVFGLARWWLANHFPWRVGFDDADHISAALRWAESWRLSDDGPFLRVPFWPMLLGTFFRIFGVKVGLFLVQASVVLGTLILYFLYTAPLRKHAHPAAIYLPPAVFVLSPQVLLYTRHAVNEPFVGLLAAAVMLVGRKASLGRGFVVGVLCGLASMTKIASAALVVPALAVALRSRAVAFRALTLAWFTLGLAVVIAPIVALHVAQRGWVPIDTTAAFDLSRYEPPEWWALGDQIERYEAGMADFRETISKDPVVYLSGFVRRLGSWILRPSSTDFARFYPDYPHGLLRVWDTVVFAVLGLAAVLGTDRRNAPIWVFILTIVVGCTFPRHTPFTPKVILIFTFLLLAPYGLARLAQRLSRAAQPSAPRSSVTGEEAP